MKRITFFILCLFSAGMVSSQSQLVIAGDISGVCDAVTTNSTQNVGIGWDACVGGIYEGTVEFQMATEATLYNVFTVSPDDVTFNDLSFGGFYPCYDSDDQASMPNSDADAPSLFFEVSEKGELGFSGSSQWGEIYSVSDVVIDGAQLYFQWINDYGEGAAVQLIRQDLQLWNDLLFSVSTQEISQIESISINPNPIRSGERVVVSLDLNQSVSMHVQLIDTTGKVISAKQIYATEGRNEFIIDSQSLDNGLYFLKLSSEDGVTTKKVIIH